MAKELNVEEKLNLIKRNLQEIIGEEELVKKLESGKNLRVYWGTMPTGSPSIAYFFPMLKVADLLAAGCNVKILLADLHAALDSVPWELVDARYEYYKEAIVTMLKIIGVDIDRLEFVRGRDIQLTPEYSQDLLKLSTLTSIHDSTKAASEGVKSAVGDNVKLSGMIYPLMQALDEQYLDVDAQFAGVDQRKIMVYAREYLPKIGYAPRIELMNPMIRGLVGEKMSSSIEGTKIDLLDGEKTIKNRINKADFIEGDVENGVMALFRYLIFTLKNGKKLIIERPEKFGGNLEFNSYDDLEKAVLEKNIHPMDVKSSLAKELTELLTGFKENKKLKDLYKKAYPEN